MRVGRVCSNPECQACGFEFWTHIQYGPATPARLEDSSYRTRQMIRRVFYFGWGSRGVFSPISAEVHISTFLFRERVQNAKFLKYNSYFAKACKRQIIIFYFYLQRRAVRPSFSWGRFLSGSDSIRFDFDLSFCAHVHFWPISWGNLPYTSEPIHSLSERYPAQKSASSEA